MTQIFRKITAPVLLGAALLAPGAPAPAQEKCPSPEGLEQTLEKTFRKPIIVENVSPSVIDRLCEVQVSLQGQNNILYTDLTGNYLVTGQIIDTAAGRNLTRDALVKLNSFTPEEMEKVASLAALSVGEKGPVVYIVTDPQ